MQARLVQGEIDVAVSANSGSVAGNVAKGAPIHFTYPDGAASTSPFGIGVMAGATHPNAARLFVEWATSADAQSKLSKIVNTSPANKNAENLAERSEERRVGKECVSTCKSRWSADTSKKTTKNK